MISEKDLLEAIAECQGERNPNANTCIKLASYYTIYQYLYGTKEYSYSPPPTDQYTSNSEFGKLIQGKSTSEIYGIIDELMEAIQVLQPRLYKGVIEKLQE